MIVAINYRIKSSVEVTSIAMYYDCMNKECAKFVHGYKLLTRRWKNVQVSYDSMCRIPN